MDTAAGTRVSSFAVHAHAELQLYYYACCMNNIAGNFGMNGAPRYCPFFRVRTFPQPPSPAK